MYATLNKDFLYQLNINHIFCVLKFQKELVLYPDKTGRVVDLLEEARKQIDFTESGKLR